MSFLRKQVFGDDRSQSYAPLREMQEDDLPGHPEGASQFRREGSVGSPMRREGSLALGSPMRGEGSHGLLSSQVPGGSFGSHDTSAYSRWAKKYILDPSDHKVSRWLDWWDSHFVIMLFATAMATPYSMAFLTPKIDFLFFLDHLTDLSFGLNMVLQVFIAYPDPKRPARYVKEPWSILKNYINGWFMWDVITVFPSDSIFILTGPVLLDIGFVQDVPILRCLRLLRLFRMFRFTLVFERLTHSSGWSFAKLTLLNFFVTLALCCHWTACIWGCVGFELELAGQHNWLSALQTAKGGEDSLYEHHFRVYILALYWAIVTLTSIGYGDITPQCFIEYVVSCFTMAIMAGMWAYVIGAVCSIVGSLHPHDLAFNQRMDDLNLLLSERNMPIQMRSRFRKYFQEAREVARTQVEESVIEQLSPMLQGECALFIYGESLKKVSYLKKLDDDVIYAVARNLELRVYAPNEEIAYQRVLSIVRRGVCACGGKLRVAGSAWGEDMLLSNPALRHEQISRALSYLSVIRLSLEQLIDVILIHPNAKIVLRYAQMKLATSRAFQLLSTTIRRWNRTNAFCLWNIPQDMREALYADILRGEAPPDASANDAALMFRYSAQGRARTLATGRTRSRVFPAFESGGGVSAADLTVAFQRGSQDLSEGERSLYDQLALASGGGRGGAQAGTDVIMAVFNEMMASMEDLGARFDRLEEFVKSDGSGGMKNLNSTDQDRTHELIPTSSVTAHQKSGPRDRPPRNSARQA